MEDTKTSVTPPQAGAPRKWIPAISWLRRRTSEERAQQLQAIADILHKRQSRSQFAKLSVTWSAGQFSIQRYGDTAPAAKTETYRQAESYIRVFYAKLFRVEDAT